MNILSDLAGLDAEGITVWAEDGKLKYACGPEPLPDFLREKLLELKSGVLKFWEESTVIPREMSGLQQAYWLGESTAFDQHSAAYLHLVFSGDLPDRLALEEAMEKLVQRHPPLGYTLDRSYPLFKVATRRPTLEWLQIAPDSRADRADASSNLVCTVPSLESESPLWKLIVIDNGVQKCLHGLFRLALFDAYSIHVVMDELIRIAKGEQLSNIGDDYDHRSFRHHEFHIKRSRVRARRYWQEKIGTLPAPASLPLADPARLEKQNIDRRFVEHRCLISQEDYTTLKGFAKHSQVSVNAVLITCYLATLSRWSESRPVCASVMYSQRDHLPEQHRRCIGNFGNLLLVGLPVQNLAFSELACQVQSDLFQAMNNAAYDGVSVIRDWRARHEFARHGGEPPMPFVFSTLLGMALRKYELRQIGHTMKTPQIWIDAQAFENEKGLVLSWDELEGVFSPGMVEQMFQYFTGWIAQLARNADVWNKREHALPEADVRLMVQVNDTAIDYPDISLVQNLHEWVLSDPNRVAFYHRLGNLTFADLEAKASILAAHLNENGVGPGDNVAILGQRTPDLIIAVYAVLMAGGVYVPLNISMPVEKIKQVITQAAATTLLIDQSVKLENVIVSPVVWSTDYSAYLRTLSRGEEYMEPIYPVVSEQLAYIIFTSGSTGVPKGVAMTHRGAVNTLQSCVRLFGLTASDRILGISELSFDLSVFDLFMPAMTGCSTVLVEGDERANPALWLEAAEQFRATVWNSVPAIMEMACLYADKAVSDLQLASSLRLFMASGDWVPLTLPDKIRAYLPDAVFVALGGATEAAIWSNYFVVEAVEPEWRSIPYGKPLDNQQYYILDRYRRLCPIGVAGTLHIGGAGLADGYFNDLAETREKFFHHPELNRRIYNTGDLGRYLRSGDIEFLGREDHQVKINGFRVELGEIEQVTSSFDDIEQAVVTYSGQGDAALHLFYVTKACCRLGSEEFERALNEHLHRYLSRYMIPRWLHRLDALPLTSNGKIDRRALMGLVDASSKNVCEHRSTRSRVSTESALQAKLLEVVRSVAPVVDGIDQDWFHRGCSSLQALYLIHAVNRTFNTKLELPDIYSASTVRRLSILVESAFETGCDETGRNLVWLHRGRSAMRDLVVFLHPVGGAVSCYLGAAEQLKLSHDVIALCATRSEGECAIARMAADYYAQLANTIGGYASVTFVGWSMGGSVAIEMARLATSQSSHARHESPQRIRVVTIDSYVGSGLPAPDEKTLLRRFLHDVERVGAVRLNAEIRSADELDEVYQGRFEMFKRNYRALTGYRPEPCGLDITCFDAVQVSSMPALVLLSSCLEECTVAELEADHYSVFDTPELGVWIETIKNPRDSGCAALNTAETRNTVESV